MTRHLSTANTEVGALRGAREIAIPGQIGYNLGMTITIDLPPDVADKLTRKAARQGRDAAGYVRQLAEREAETEETVVPPSWDPSTLAAWEALLDSFAEGEPQDHRETVAVPAQARNAASAKKPLRPTPPNDYTR